MGRGEAMSPALRIITPQAASLEGYVEISVPISKKLEPEIFASMEATLTGTDSVFVDHGNGSYSAARRRSELKFDEPKRRIQATDSMEAKKGESQP
jgi:hypothetical protein